MISSLLSHVGAQYFHVFSKEKQVQKEQTPVNFLRYFLEENYAMLALII